MPSLTRHAAPLLVALSTVYAAVSVIAGPQWTVDDAFIVARYAHNLVHHGRLAWNLDGPPVEGLTGYALPLVMAAAEILHVSPLAAATGVGVASLFVGAALVHACHRPLGVGPLAGAVGYAAYLTAAEQTTHALSGLETELFMALTVATAWAALRTTEPARDGLPSKALPLLAAACALTRPEGALVGAAFLAAVLYRERARLRASLRVAGIWFALPLAALEGFRLAYYRSLLPNTYYAKRLPGFDGAFVGTLAGLARDYVAPALVALAAVLVVARCLGGPAPPPAGRAAAGILLFGGAVGALGMGIVYSRSELVMGYSWRFAFHLYGLAALLVELAAGRVLQALSRLGAASAPAALRGVVGALAAVAFGTALLRGVAKAGEERTYRRLYREIMTSTYVPAAGWLSGHVGAEATVAYYPDAGVIPYLVGRRAVDFGKLNDAYLARDARGADDVADYFFRLAPDVLVMTHKQGPSNAGGLARAKDATGDRLLADARFSDYRLARFFATPGFGLGVYVRR